MIYKYYRANAVNDGVITGCFITRVWFWQNPYNAVYKILKMAKDGKSTFCDLERIK